MLPLISVITPAFNSADTIARAVNSVVGQSYADWEMLIISDDGRDYAAILAEQGIVDHRLRYLSSGGVGTGPNATRNVGLSHARGSYIAPLDADDFFYPTRLLQLLPLAEKCGVATANVDVFDDLNDKYLYSPFDKRTDVGELAAEQFMALSTPMLLLIRRNLISYPWNPDVQLGEDTLFNLRVIEAAGGSVPLNYQALHSYRIHGNSICHSDSAAAKAESAYRYCLAEIDKTGLGFKTEKMREQVRNMLVNKRELNQHYAVARRNGFGGTFQDYYAEVCNA